MNIIKRISKTAFRKLNSYELFKEDKEAANNSFAVISESTNCFKIAWNSDIEPMLIEIDANIYGIGIDQHFSIVDLNCNSVLLNINLFYNFFVTKLQGEWIYLITELEIIKISKLDFKIVKNYALPDYFEGIEFLDGQVIVKCSGNEIVILN